MEKLITTFYYVGLAIFIISLPFLFFCKIESTKQRMLSLLFLLVGTGLTLPALFMNIPKNHSHTIINISYILFLVWGYGMLINIIDINKKLSATLETNKRLANKNEELLKTCKITIDGGKDDVILKIKEFLETHPEVTQFNALQRIIKADEDVAKEIRKMIKEGKISEKEEKFESDEKKRE